MDSLKWAAWSNDTAAGPWKHSHGLSQEPLPQQANRLRSLHALPLAQTMLTPALFSSQCTSGRQARSWPAGSEGTHCACLGIHNATCTMVQEGVGSGRAGACAVEQWRVSI